MQTINQLRNATETDRLQNPCLALSSLLPLPSVAANAHFCIMARGACRIASRSNRGVGQNDIDTRLIPYEEAILHPSEGRPLTTNIGVNAKVSELESVQLTAILLTPYRTESNLQKHFRIFRSLEALHI